MFVYFSFRASIWSRKCFGLSASLKPRSLTSICRPKMSATMLSFSFPVMPRSTRWLYMFFFMWSEQISWVVLSKFPANALDIASSSSVPYARRFVKSDFKVFNEPQKGEYVSFVFFLCTNTGPMRVGCCFSCFVSSSRFSYDIGRNVNFSDVKRRVDCQRFEKFSFTLTKSIQIIELSISCEYAKTAQRQPERPE